MPVLPVEPNIFPAELFEEAEVEDERWWWVLHTKPRQEKALARELVRARVPFYLPLIERKNLVRGHLLSSYVPLFTSYLFVRATGAERIAALSTRRTVRSLQVRDQELLRADLLQVHRLITSGLPITPEQQLYPGVTVEVRTGSLAGLKGKIIREASGGRFVVQVDFIQQGASVTLDDYLLAAIDDRELLATPN
jgi:transcriptional antiterminator RfaH